MAYELILKSDVYCNSDLPQKATVASLDIVNGTIHVGSYYVPISNFVLIKEV